MKQQTAVEWLIEKLESSLINTTGDYKVKLILGISDIEQAKEMEKEQIGYSKEDVIKAGEMGEINYLDTLHIVTYLDEAKQFNETYGGNK